MKGIITILLLGFMSALHAQINSVKRTSGDISQFERADFSIQLTGNWTNPYLQEEISLDMLLLAPNGEKLILPCFYVSGKSGETSDWAARFTPQQAGKYQYEFRLSENGKEISRSEKFNFNSKSSDLKGFLHTKNNWVLQFDNGQPFRGIAENLCWESRANDDSRFFKELHQQERFNYDYLIPLFAKNGGNFCRVWMCSWNFPIDRKDHFNNNRYTASDEYFNPSAVQRLDHFVELCKKEDVYVMLCLGQGDVSADNDFFISDVAKAKYKNRLRYIVARWGYSPNIGMWEFFNEIDNIQFRHQNSPIPAADIVGWHTEMASYLKSIDPYNHIRTTSISHRDLDGLNSVTDLDINQKHIYKNTSGIPAEIEKYVTQFGKPYVIGEFGYEWDWSKNFDEFPEGMDFDFKRGLWYGLFTATPVTPMSWWWEYFENRGLMSYFRGVREINDQMLEAGKGDFKPVKIQANGLEAYAVQCGKKIFVYLLNQSDENRSSCVSLETTQTKMGKVQRFYPGTLKYGDHKNTDSLKGAFVIDNVEVKAKDELVLILSGK